MRIVAAIALLVVAAFAGAQEIVYSIEINPEQPTTNTPVLITIDGFCYGDLVRSGNVFTVTVGTECIPEPIQIEDTFNVGRLEAGTYEVRIVPAENPATPLATRAFAVAPGNEVPALHEYAAIALVMLLAVAAVRRMS
jgi:hypothetical protein